MYAGLRNLNNGLRCLLGLISRRWVFGGPRSAAFILSSECNSHCIMCWFHSPLGVRQILFLPVQAEGHLSRHVVLSEDEETELRGHMSAALHLAARLDIRTNLAEYMATNRFVRNGMPDTAELYRQIPCYVGWTYSEFDLDGTMRPCEKSQIVLGKAGSSKIREMWRSQPYRRFRREGRLLPTRTETVTGCACGTCSMAKFNINIHNLLQLKSTRYYEA
jgi:hypothetical protein